ncbi:MAG: AAA family ATPase [Alphaproteobacteria bacterium]|nr:AAA family ATPase [Alphaproteobacteria bacterium]
MTSLKINSIDKIENFYSFKSFVSPSGLQSFANRNLFYGWNGTGKTTLSQFFAELSKNDNALKYPSTKIQVSLSDGSQIKNLGTNPLSNIKAFNQFFVEENCKIQNDRNIAPRIFLGKDVGDTLTKIADKEKEITTEKGLQKDIDYNNKNNAFDEFKSSGAGKVKTEFTIPTYGPTHLVRDIDAAAVSTITSDDEYLSKKKSISEEGKSLLAQGAQITELPTLSIDDLPALSQEPITLTTIKELEENEILKKWVDEGYRYYTDNNLNACQFCGATLQQARIDELQGYFNDANTKLQSRLNDIAIQLNIPLQNLPDRSLLFSSIVSKFDQAKEALDKATTDYNTKKDEIVTKINNKKKNPDKSDNDVCVSTGMLSALLISRQNLQNAIVGIKTTLEEHDTIVNNFKTEKDEAFNQCKRYFIEKHVLAEYSTKKTDLETSKFAHDAKQIVIDRLQEEKQGLDNSISSNNPTIINEFIEKLIGNQNFKLEETADKKGYLLSRSIDNKYERAEKVSEGEQTIIAFAYFLGTLHESGVNIADTIIVIDDPVSSLDSNFIHNIVDIIDNEIIKKNPAQLFVLTHNFYFFKLMSRAMGGLKPENIYRVDKDDSGSYIRNAERSLAVHKNEYLFLADYLKENHTATKQKTPSDDDLVHGTNIINSIRRFLEVFLSFKYPRIKNEDGKDIPKGDGFTKHMEEFYKHHPTYASAKRICGLANRYSHETMTSVEADPWISGIVDIKSLLEEFMLFVKHMDEPHYKSLFDISEP